MDVGGRRYTISCPEGGAACSLTVAEDGTVTYTGGVPTVSDPTVIMTELELPAGHGLETGEIAAGASRTVDVGGRRYTISCPEGGAACSLTVAEDGTVTYAGTGGTPTVGEPTVIMTELELPAGHGLATGEIAAGASRTVDVGGRRYTISCPEGGAACSLTVAEDGTVTYAGTGGTPTVGDPTVIMTELAGLPSSGGHGGLATGEIEAGASVTTYDVGRTIVVSCPSGGAACSLTVDGSTVTYAETGATPTVRVTTNNMLWQANNGPAGTSDGAHAAGLTDRLVAKAASLGTPTTRDLTGIVTGSPLGEGSMQTTMTAPTVTPSMKWVRGPRPTFGLTLGSATFSGLDSGALPANSGRLDSDSGSTIPGLGSGWNGASLSKDLSMLNGRTIHGVVYTNAAKPTGTNAAEPARSFAEGFDLSGHSALSTALGGSSDVTADQEFTIEGFKVTIPQAAFNTLRTGAFQATPITVTVEYTEDGATKSRSGQLTCEVLQCRSVGGQLQGTWDLKALAGDDRDGTQDTDYQVLGSWLVLPNADSGDPTDSYNFGVFQFAASGGRLTETQLDGNAGDTDGNITFEGPATGIYTTGSYSGTGSSRRLTGEVGAFTADVELVGKFGTGTGADSFTGVTGTVNGFMDNRGNSLPWTMSLEDTGSSSGGTNDTGELFTGETTLETTGGQSAEGHWGVQFYWNSQRDPAGLGFAGGTFDASTAVSEDNALHVIGAFAADRED